jgi:filamentous hemagglutinin family protein
MYKTIINVFQYCVILLLITSSVCPVHANELYPKGIILDGSIGAPPENLNLDGPNYQIHESYGHRSNNNLFHSFEQFNIHANESATFLGSPDIKNVISRVTGGYESWIDGSIKSNISGADFFFMNPSGIVFGPNANLDLNASFHTSTADYLLMEDQQRFYSSHFQSSVLSTSPPFAFGFLENNNGSISINQSELSVKDKQTLSFCSQDINVDNADILSPDGVINLVNTGLQCEYLFNNSGLTQLPNETQGTIHLSDNSLLSTTGDESSGSVFILGGNLFVEDMSTLDASTYGKSGGEINIHVNNLQMTHGALISAENYGAYHSNQDDITRKKGADITISAHDSIIISDGSKIISTAYDDIYYDAGNISIQAKTIKFTKGSGIESQTLNAGRGGDIDISVTDSFLMSDWKISTSTYSDQSISENKEIFQGHAGNISISGPEISFVNGGGLSSQTYGIGRGGNIDIVNAKNINLYGTNSSGFACTFHAYSFKEDSGDSGNITINSQNLIMKDGAAIFAGTKGKGAGGNISIMVTDNLKIMGVNPMGENNEGYVSGLFSRSEGAINEAGDAGTISIDAKNILINDEATVSTSTNGPGNAGNIAITGKYIEMNTNGLITSESNADQHAGEAGSIGIKSEKCHIKGNSHISTNASHAGGGIISVSVSDEIFLQQSNVTTNVSDGQENGGDITLQSGMVLLNNSEIQANAFEGDGGAIFIHTDAYIKSNDSIVEASSERGNDGTIKIVSPKVSISDMLTVMPSNVLNAEKWIKKPCSKRYNYKTSQFTQRFYHATPLPLDNWISSRPLLTNHIVELDHHEINSAISLFNGGNFRGAATYFENHINQIDHQSNAYSDVLFFLTHAYRHLGLHQKALSIIDKQMNTPQSAYSAAIYHNILGDIYLSFGEIQKAIGQFKNAKNKAIETNNSYVLAMVYHNIGITFALDEDYDAAMSLFHECLKQIEKQPNLELRPIVLANIARTFQQFGDIDDTVANMKKAFDQIKGMSNSWNKAVSLVSLSQILNQVHQKDHSKQLKYKILLEAQKTGEEIHAKRILSYAFGYMGRLYEYQHRYPEAIVLTNKAIFQAQSGNFSESLYLWQWQSGRILHSSGQNEKAIYAFQNAIKILNPIRNTLYKGSYNNLNIFNGKVRPVYLGLADLLLKQAEMSTNKQKQQHHLLKAIDVMEQLKIVELENYYIDECIAETKHLTIGNTTALNTAFIYTT